MAKDTVADWSTTAADNTDIGGIAILGSDKVSNFDNALRTIMAQLARDTKSVLVQSYDAAALIGATAISYDLPAEFRRFEIEMAGIRSTSPGIIGMRFGTTAGGALSSGSTDYVETSMQSIGGGSPTGAAIATAAMTVGYTFTDQYGHQSISLDKGQAETVANLTTTINSITAGTDIIAVRGGRRQALGQQNRIGFIFSQPLLESGFIKIYGIR